jgi:hypothetical protein
MKNTIFALIGLAAYLLLCDSSMAADPVCTLETVKGTYGMTGSALVPEKLKDGQIRFDPTEKIARVTYDGFGKITMRAKIQYHGKVRDQNLTGTYSVSESCEGMVTWNDDSGATVERWAFIVAGSGVELPTMAMRYRANDEVYFSMAFSQRRL